MTDAERTKIGYLSNVTDKEDLLCVICAGRVSSSGSFIACWGKYRNPTTVTVKRISIGTYIITHNAGVPNAGIVNARMLASTNMATMWGMDNNSAKVSIYNINGLVDDEFTFIIFRV